MAKLSKEEYERRVESASFRHEENKTIPTLTESQHDIIAEVCTMRHNLHCSGDELYLSESLFSKQSSIWLEEINWRLINLKLPTIKNIPRVEDFPSVEDQYCGIIEEEEEEENVEKFFSVMNDLNNSIEEWLNSIDLIHGTNYCPTGMQRIMI